MLGRPAATPRSSSPSTCPCGGSTRPPRLPRLQHVVGVPEPERPPQHNPGERPVPFPPFPSSNSGRRRRNHPLLSAYHGRACARARPVSAPTPWPLQLACMMHASPTHTSMPPQPHLPSALAVRISSGSDSFRSSRRLALKLKLCTCRSKVQLTACLIDRPCPRPGPASRPVASGMVPACAPVWAGPEAGGLCH